MRRTVGRIYSSFPSLVPASCRVPTRPQFTNNVSLSRFTRARFFSSNTDNTDDVGEPDLSTPDSDVDVWANLCEAYQLKPTMPCLKFRRDMSVEETVMSVEYILTEYPSVHPRELVAMQQDSHHHHDQELSSFSGFTESSRIISDIHFNGDIAVVRIEEFAAVITPTCAYIFDYQRTGVSELLRFLNKDPYYDTEYRTFQTYVVNAMVLESVHNFERRLNIISPVVQATAWSIQERPEEDALLQMTLLDRSLRHFKFGIRELHTALTSIQVEHASAKAIDSLRRLKAHYSRRCEEMGNEVEMLLKHTITTQQMVYLSLDSSRNKLMELSVKVSIGAFSVGAGSMLAGVAGMNFLNHFEEHHYMFSLAVAGIACAGAGSYIALMHIFQKKRKSVCLSEKTSVYRFFGQINRSDYVRDVHSHMRAHDFGKAMSSVFGTSEEHWKDQLDLFDKDNDGTISDAEFKAALTSQAIGTQLSDKIKQQHCPDHVHDVTWNGSRTSLSNFFASTEHKRSKQ